MRNKSFFFIFTLIVSLGSASVQTAAQTVQTRIDSLLAVLPAADNDTNKVMLLCEISRAYFQPAPDKGVVYGNHALNLANQLRFERGAMKANMAIGRCQAVRHELPMALKHFSDALALARKLNSKEDIANGLLSIGTVYSEKGEFEKAIRFMTEAKEAYKVAGVKKRQMVLGNIGSVYTKMKRYPEALSYFREAIQVEEAEQANPGLLTTTYINIGAVYAGLGRYDSSLHYLFKALKNSEITGNRKSAGNTMCNIGKVYLDLSKGNFPLLPDSLRNRTGNLEKSIEYGKQSLAITYELGLQQLRSDVLLNISIAYRELGKYKDALEYFDQHYFLKDSLTAMDQERAFAKAEAEFNARKTTDSLKYENLLKDKELKKRRSDRNKLIAIISLIGISGLLLINSQKLKHVQKRKEAEAQKQLAEELATQQLHDFTKNIQEKNDMIEVISAEIAKLKEKEGSTGILLDETLLSELRQSILLTDLQWDSFRATFDKVHPGYLSRLKTRMPDLTPAETRFVVLSKLKLSPREMAGMLGITPPAVRASKYRLMKKFGFDDDLKLDELIQNV
jgi:tetratricopeptide (TPR) repeat protein/DNA-binding CsgD family transcriptional regulator